MPSHPRAESASAVPFLPGRREVVGLAMAGMAVPLAWFLSRLVPGVSILTWAVVLGLCYANSRLVTTSVEPGTRWASQRLLRIGVVLLGLQLAAPQVLGLGLTLLAFLAFIVVVSFYGTLWLGKRLGLTRGHSLMVATGFSICGASAIIAMKEVSDADEDDVASGIALVTICGTLAIFVLPTLGELMALSPREYGVWAGASVHEVAQVVASASPVAGALEIAVVVKLTRVVLLAPMVALQSTHYRRRTPAGSGPAPALMPLFVVGFIGAIAVRSTGLLPEQVVATAAIAQTIILAGALFGLGCAVNLSRLRRLGMRSLLLGLGSWVWIAMLGLGVVAIVGPF